DMLQPLGKRLVELALADEAGDQEQRLLDDAAQRRRVAENDLGLLEQPLGEQHLGPAEVSVGESVPPLRPGLLLEELLVELDGLLESAETQRLLGLRSGRAGHGRGEKLARVRSGHAASFLPTSLAMSTDRRLPTPFIPNPLSPTRDGPKTRWPKFSKSDFCGTGVSDCVLGSTAMHISGSYQS